MRFKIRKGDTVEIISGRDKGTKGEVLRVLAAEERIVVRGVNLRKKHQRQVQAGGRQMNPGIIHFEAPIHVSNAMLVCPKCGEATRVAVRRTDDKSQRVCKQCESVIDA